MIAMLVVGCVLLLFIAPWEAKVAKYPVLPGRFLKNKSIVGASLIGFFDFVGAQYLPVCLVSAERCLRFRST